MKTYILLLRGINVSGQKKILMADLKKHMSELDFKNVQTYIQSGNVVFQSEKNNKKELQQEIENLIYDKYNFELTVFLITPEELKKVLMENPFRNDPEKNEQLTYFTFLNGKPVSVENIDSEKYAPEEFLVKGKIIYFYPPNGYGKAKMNNNFFEKKLKVKGTTRNLNTCKKLIELSNELKG